VDFSVGIVLIVGCLTVVSRYGTTRTRRLEEKKMGLWRSIVSKLAQPRRAAASICAVAAALGLVANLAAQQSPVANADWPLYSLDLKGGRYSPLHQITDANVKNLQARWLFETGVIDGVSNQTTPIVVDGMMYVTDSRGSVSALDAADGHLIWDYDVTKLIGGGAKEGFIFRNRGVCYANGVVYAPAGSFLFALDAKTGKPIESFGEKGKASIVLDVLRSRYPNVSTAISLGYWFTAAPQIYNGVIYLGTTRSESHIPGGHVLAVDAKTGKVLWSFNTIPQDEKDQGWDVASPTWVGGERNGGGIWSTPAIDPELGLLYVAVGNPFGPSEKRAGTNLFTNAILALTLDGKLKWYYQQVHHDVWDYDSGGSPILFDMQVRGRTVKAVAEANKAGFLYILDRETGQPVHPIKEMPVSTETSTPGEQPWPTQPFPFTAAGKPMQPVVPQTPIDISPTVPKNYKAVPLFTPRGPNQIFAPGSGDGGASYGALSYSPQTGYIYVNGIDRPSNAGRGAMGYFSAFDPSTGELVWQQKFEGFGQGGSVVTAGNVVFVGTGSNTAGYFFAFNAKTGAPLWKFNTGGGVFGSPSLYSLNGEEFVAVASGGGERGRRGGDLILTFALPKP
jgi:alcohol dehydrogenase (cytochrome c)